MDQALVHFRRAAPARNGPVRAYLTGAFPPIGREQIASGHLSGRGIPDDPVQGNLK